MTQQLIIAGTDANVGKTLFSAALMLAINEAGKKPYYWKPIECGSQENLDRDKVKSITQLPEERFCAEMHLLSAAVSPHLGAEIDSTPINIDALHEKTCFPETDGVLIIEGIGGLMVPLSGKNLQINVFRKWKTPLILVANSEMGTINHTLLALESLWARRIPIKGIVFVGKPDTQIMQTISKFSNVKILGCLPITDSMDAEHLKNLFHDNFKLTDFI